VRRICILFLFLTSYYLSLANGNIHSRTETNINWIIVWLSFLFGVLFTILFRFLNRKSKTIDQRSDAGLPLSGWVILLGLTLAIRILLQGFALINEHYFLNSTWIQLEHAGGMKLHFLSIFELFLSLFSLISSGVLLYWFFGRRDIFPSMFIFYVIFFLIAQFVLWIVYNNITIPVDLSAIRNEMLNQFFRLAVYAVIWGAYVWNSEQVKQTFVYPPG
jgi:uncharacterized membrane protein YqjE